MLFNSLVFLFLFLPATLIGFYFLGNKFGKSAAFFWLIVASMIFYASWQLSYIWLLICSLIFNFAAAKWIEKTTRGRIWIAGFAVFINVAILVYYKVIVAGLFGASQQGSAAFSTTKDVLIPLAISFITFQKVAFIVDTYHRKISRASALEYCLFIVFFPQLVMGPIVHYRELIPQFRAPNIAKWNSDNFALGLSILIIGLFKKVVIADSIAPYVNQVYESLQLGKEISPADAWGAAIGFSMQIYFDFSGYADAAIGLGRMFNINLPINFDSPYRALDRFDYWRRWHISFGSFMRQYVFFPLARAKKFRLGNLGSLIFTTMLSAFWHGLGITFIIWGAIQALIMTMIHYRNILFERVGLKQTHKKSAFTTGLKILLTFCVTFMIGIFFRSPDLSVALGMIGKMYDGVIAIFMGAGDQSEMLINKRTIKKLIFMAVVIWGLPNTQRFFGSYWSAIDQRQSIPKNTADLLPGAKYLRFAPTKICAAVITVLFVLVLLSMDETSRFIYYQF